jgi:3',5'-cyclic AMP phosphodiesterase CpdA
MKHIIIGDLHGKDCWRDIQIERYDKVIFLGDYVDHWTLPDRVIYQNLQNIIDLKKRHHQKIELMLGNHDVQYLHFPHYLCSGFRPGMQRSLTLLFNEHRGLFKVAYQRENYIISHAGITNRWYRDFLAIALVQKIRDEKDTVADLLNKTEQTAQRWILHQAGSSRGGDGPGGITWADRKELIADMLDGYHQIVGHTVIPRMESVTQTNKSATFIDVLDNDEYFHEIEI